MIGSLLYLTTSIPDIVFSVGLCFHFQSKPKQTHLKAVERVLRYLKHTSGLALWYSRECNFDLIGYAVLIMLDSWLIEKPPQGWLTFLNLFWYLG